MKRRAEEDVTADGTTAKRREDKLSTFFQNLVRQLERGNENPRRCVQKLLMKMPELGITTSPVASAIRSDRVMLFIALLYLTEQSSLGSALWDVHTHVHKDWMTKSDASQPVEKIDDARFDRLRHIAKKSDAKWYHFLEYVKANPTKTQWAGPALDGYLATIQATHRSYNLGYVVQKDVPAFDMFQAFVAVSDRKPYTPPLSLHSAMETFFEKYSLSYNSTGPVPERFVHLTGYRDGWYEYFQEPQKIMNQPASAWLDRVLSDTEACQPDALFVRFIYAVCKRKRDDKESLGMVLQGFLEKRELHY